MWEPRMLCVDLGLHVCGPIFPHVVTAHERSTSGDRVVNMNTLQIAEIRNDTRGDSWYRGAKDTPRA